MTYQQAIFVKGLITNGTPINKLAENFYKEFGSTEHCRGPESSTFFKGRRINLFSSLQGNDILYAASTVLREKLSYEQKSIYEKR